MHHRPLYHFLPEKNWMNDPNATIYFNGEHHLFYQHNPTDWHWGNLHWGHATSKDLLHWQHQPIAMGPAGWGGELNCYSGCSYIHNGKIELLYTSVGEGSRCQHSGSEQWAATTEDGVHWTQIRDNPVMRIEDCPGKTLTEWRDPFVFQWKGKTYAAVAGVVDGLYGAIHLYTSEDMRHWRYVSQFHRNETPEEVMECPNIVVMGDKVLFIYSVWNVRVLRYFVGTIAQDMTMTVYHKGSVDFGDFFASQISFDENGRPLLWGWLREDPRRGVYTDGPWAGAQAIPREISLNEHNELVLKRLKRFDTLRRGKEEAVLNQFKGRHELKLKSRACEICAEIKGDRVFSLEFLCSADGRERTQVIFNPREGTYYAPMEESSLLDTVDKRPLLGSFPVEATTVIDILVDCSVAEVFVNGRSCMSLRIYPTLDGEGIAFESKDGVEEARLEAYEISL